MAKMGWRSWLAAIGAAIAALLGLLWGAQRRGEAAGEEIGRIKEGRKRLREAAETGDDAGVLDEWRRSRQ